MDIVVFNKEFAVQQIIQFIRMCKGRFIRVIKDSSIEKVLIECEHNHMFTMLINKLSWCPICWHLMKLRRHDPYTTACTTLALGYSRLIYKCGRGHQFVANSETRSCNTCIMMNIINRRGLGTYRVDLDSIFEDYNSLMRFRCETVIKCYGCNGCNSSKFPIAPHLNVAKQCPHGQRCNKDFIATPQQMIKEDGSTQYYKHNGHLWHTHAGIINTIRIFELIYECKFNDLSTDKYVRFTGYNKHLRIAFIHGLDMMYNFKYSNQKALAHIRKHCTNNGILLLLFPDEVNSLYSLLRIFVTMMMGPHINPAPWHNLMISSDASNYKKLNVNYITRIIYEKFKDTHTYFSSYARV